MRESRIMSRKAGGVWGCKPHSIRCGKEYGLVRNLLRAEQASPDFYAEQELRSCCLAKHSDTIAKDIIKVSSYGRKEAVSQGIASFVFPVNTSF